jgi:hypothetical protein
MKIKLSKQEFVLLSRRNALVEAATRDLAIATRVTQERQGAMNDMLSFFAQREGAADGDAFDGMTLSQDDESYYLTLNPALKPAGSGKPLELVAAKEAR